MRTLGPGSVSSVLKIILDIFYVVLWVFFIGLAAMALLAVLLSFNSEFLEGFIRYTGDDGDEFKATARPSPWAWAPFRCTPGACC